MHYQMTYVRRLVAPLAPRIRLSEVGGAGVGLVSGTHIARGQDLFTELPHVMAPEVSVALGDRNTNLRSTRTTVTSARTV